MCGIIGIATKSGGRSPDVKKEIFNIFEEMLVNCQRRGPDATGVLATLFNWKKRAFESRILKAPLIAHRFIETAQFKEFRDKVIDKEVDIVNLIGHTRMPTGGSSSSNINNHPHISGPFIGVHNGVVNDGPIWKLCDGIVKKSSCDSEAIFALLNKAYKEKHNTISAMREAALHIHGWYALAMVNTEEPRALYLVRDSGTPLKAYHSTETYKDVLFFCSTGDMIEDSATRKVSKLFKDIKEVNIPANSIAKFKCDDPYVHRERVFEELADIKVANKEADSRFIEENEGTFATTQAVHSRGRYFS